MTIILTKYISTNRTEDELSKVTKQTYLINLYIATLFLNVALLSVALFMNLCYDNASFNFLHWKSVTVTDGILLFRSQQNPFML